MPKKTVVFKSKHGYLALTRKGKGSIKFNQHPELGHGEYSTSDPEEIDFIRGHSFFMSGAISE